MKSILIIICCLSFFIAACGSSKVINDVKYETYGLISENDKKAPNIRYRPVWGNIIWGVLLTGTIIAPVYFFGFSMFEPIGVETENIYEKYRKRDL